ncbi:MAG TPA: glycine oxidase ThiO, partial [Longimicrobiaceae bacterium]|nr:glycine oxidase ThiO [Longimicrobiaceae bacterium]
MSTVGTLVVGGGVVGLGIAWKLAEAGEPVTVLERDAEGAPPSAAAWGAGGMLAPLSEAGFDEPEVLALGRASLELYPRWVEELEAASGESVGYRTEGTLLAALDRDDAAWLERQHRYQESLGLPTEWLSGAELLEREPHLAPSVVAGVYSAADHQVDGRRMWRALRTAFERAGGQFVAGTEVLRIAHEGGRARGAVVRGRDGEEERMEADRVVVCAGAWTRLLMREGLPPEAVPPIRPVKGQLLALGTTELLRPSHVVRTRRVYLVPKQDGRLLVGATVEEMGFDRRLTAGGVFELLRDAWEAMPGIYDLPLVESWAGFRPASRDNAPVLGGTPLEGLFVATGHYRNGILLTPITAHAVRELLLEG